jgi:uncharacterized protein (TIGR03067 family)
MLPFTLLLFCALGATEDRESLAKTELAKLEGTWREVGGEEAGYVLTPEAAKKEECEFVFKRNSLALRIHGKVGDEFKFSVDPFKNPKEMDLVFTKGKNIGKKCLAIYSVSGDQLKICTGTKLRPTRGGPRPNVFTTQKTQEESICPGLLLIILERQKYEPENISVPAARKKSADSVLKLVLALHQYHDDHGDMPPATLCGKDGRVLLSWRVLILPYLEEQKLYEEFHLGEPWDSPHNKKLLGRMPEVFAPLDGEARKEHRTFYQVFVGPDTPFKEKNRGPRVPASFPDGTSKTFLLVEAGEAVPWTAPRDLKYDAKKPIPKLGGLLPDGFHAAMADGSIRFFKKGKLSEKTLRAAITPAGKDLLGDDFFR